MQADVATTRTTSRRPRDDAPRHWPASLDIPIPEPDPAPDLPDLSALAARRAPRRTPRRVGRAQRGS